MDKGLEDMVRRIVREEILAIRAERQEVWISQAQAFKMAGRGKVERAMSSNLVRWTKKDYNEKYSRVMVRKADILKLIEKPFV